MKRLLLVLISIGWLLPAWLGVSLLLTFLETEAWPLLRGGQAMNSFPFLLYSSRCFAVAFVWFAAVAAFWVWQLSGRVLARPIDSRASVAAGRS